MNDVVDVVVLASGGFAAGIDWLPTLLLVAAGALAAMLLGAALAVLVRRRRPRPLVVPEPVRPAGEVSDQRAALIAGCLKAIELVDDDVVAEVLDDALRTGGVTVYEATGSALEPSRHRVNHTIPAPDSASDGIVVETIRAGYCDGSTVLRPADVIVYKWQRR